MTAFKPYGKELATLKESCLGIFGFFLGFAGFLSWQHELVSPPLALIALVVGIAAFCAAKLMGRKRKEKQKTDYAAHLSTVPIETLVAVVKSPEFDSGTKAAVLEYLNAQHPGWSIP